MARTFIRQLTQIAESDTYDDTIAPTEANYETNPANIEDDFNSIRSKLSYLQDIQTGDWFDAQTAPSALEAGTLRGVDNLNDALHLVEKKRVLRCYWGLNAISIASAGDTYDILGTGELPGNTTAAVGAVTTLGTVVADGSGSFGSHQLAEVAGPTAISPKNLVQIVDDNRDPVLDAGDRIYGLLQSETATDGHTITDTTTTRVQISFVKLNPAGTDLIAITSGAMDGVTYDYCYVERVRLEDLNEADFLGGANVDVPAGSTVTRQVAYDNQGATVVSQTSNATLDLATGLTWEIGDAASAPLFQVIEGSAGGTSQVNIPVGVDEFDVDAVVNNFANGVSIDTGSGSPIDIGVTDGHVETTSGDLHLQAAAEMYLDDVNQTGSTWAQTDGIKLSETTAEWDLFETNFGEVSLLNAISQAFSGGVRTKVQATVTSNVSADTDVNGPGTAHSNTDVDLAPYDTVTFVDDVEVFLNGELLRNAANDGGGEDVYPGGDPSDGDLKFQFSLKGTGSKPDQITVIVNGQ